MRLKPTLSVGRAEGAVLAAAGELGIDTVNVITGAGVRAAGGGSTDEAVQVLCGPLRDLPSEDSARRAAAAVRAWRIRNP